MAEAIRVCSMCGKAYAPEYADTFCVCGFELVAPAPGAPVEAPPPPVGIVLEQPPPGTRCLVLYSADRQPLHYFPLTKDVTSIGRQDPVEANFPDIDVGEWLEEASARKISREHALIVRSRANDSLSVRPLAGNTGTQLETDMLPPQQDFLLHPGQRLILGGVARFKYVIA